MDVQDLLDNVQDLTDLELAILLCLVADEHCLLVVEDDLVNDLASEISLIVSERFGLSHVVLEPDQLESVEAFCEAVLDEKSEEFSANENEQPGSLRARLASVNMRAAPISHKEESTLDNRMVASVVIAKGFNFSDNSVQTQALELIRRRRILSRTTVHIAPKTFLFLPIVAKSSKNRYLNSHLNDRIFISHEHLPENGFTNLEELEASHESRASSTSSIHRQFFQGDVKSKRIEPWVIDRLKELRNEATMTPEVRRYLQNIVTFLRMERGVASGVSPNASTQFVLLSKLLAPLHGINYVTPSLVALAARKVYPHRIMISSPEAERSMQYGSDIAAVQDYLDDLTPEEVVETVLSVVPCPV